MKYPVFLLVPLILLCGCASKTTRSQESVLTSMQVIDRNGFSETVSTKDRLSTYDRVDFLAAQPYKKVMRVYGKNAQGQSTSKITSYHDNGHIWQYLEAVDGRANGAYKEWHPNGTLKVEAHIIEGVADITEIAQTSWLFNGKNTVWDEEGTLQAEIFYDKGLLHTPSLYYYPTGQLKKRIPYQQNLIEGFVELFNQEGQLTERFAFQKGIREGEAIGYWKDGSIQFAEQWKQGRLETGEYRNTKQEKISSIEEGKGVQTLFKEGHVFSQAEYLDGAVCGVVNLFDPQGELTSSYTIKENQKHGEEIGYYPKKTKEPLKQKISLFWQHDSLQGLVKTWYENGTQESQKEMTDNKKHGLSFAWFKNGELMLSEEYENDTLVKGSYYKKGHKQPVSKIDAGKGTATLHTPDGHFLKKIPYEKGKPAPDPSH